MNTQDDINLASTVIPMCGIRKKPTTGATIETVSLTRNQCLISVQAEDEEICQHIARAEAILEGLRALYNSRYRG